MHFFCGQTPFTCCPAGLRRLYFQVVCLKFLHIQELYVVYRQIKVYLLVLLGLQFVFINALKVSEFFFMFTQKRWQLVIRRILKKKCWRRCMIQGLKRWQKVAQARWKRAMDCEITGGPSITISNSRFNQSVMSSEVRPAGCAGARLSHQLPVPQETKTGEQQQLPPESTKRPGLPKSEAGSISRAIT